MRSAEDRAKPRVDQSAVEPLVMRLRLPLMYRGDDTAKTNTANLERREAAGMLDQTAAVLRKLVERCEIELADPEDVPELQQAKLILGA